MYWKENFERAYLANLLDWGDDVMWITEDNLHLLPHKLIFKHIKKMLEWGEPIDMMTIRESLSNTNELEAIGGNQSLIDIVETQHSLDSMAYYVWKIRQESRRIETVKIATQIMRAWENGNVESADVIWFADKLLSLNNLESSAYSLGSIIEDTMWYIESRQGKELFWWSFGTNLKFLDQYTKGIQKWRTYRIGAVSNLGKSQLSYNIIVNLLEQDAKVAFFTLENEKSFTVTNIMANRERVNSNSIVSWEAKVDFWWLDRYADKFFLIDEEYELSKIFARILQIKPDVVVLDYIGLVSMNKVSDDEVYTKYAKAVQAFVKRTGISLIDLSNLPKDADEDNIRTYGWYFGSSFLRNNTDVGIHLFRYKPFYEWRKSSWLVMDDAIRNVQVVTMLISKNRIWTAWVEQVFKLDFNKGGLFTPATDKEIDMWNF